MSDTINVTRSALPPIEEYMAEISSLWETRWLTNMGEKHQKLEQGLKDYLDVPYATLYANGHLALENILGAMDLKGEVITTPFTFVATTHAIVRNGLTPIFCDVRESDYTMDPAKIEALITPQTCAIVPVHVYGNLCDVEAIEAIAIKHNLKVIYDGAHAFGETLNGVGVANFGDATMFSFHATKVFHTVEGGAVVYKDAALKDQLDCMKNFGIPGDDRIAYAGGNAKLSEMHAAMGVCNLRHVDEYIEARRKVAHRYMENLKGVPGLKVWQEQPSVRSNYAYFPVVFDGYKYNRDQISDMLAADGIHARKYFYPLANDCECYGYHGEDTPVAWKVSKNVLTLPIYPELSMENVDRICRIIVE